MRNSITSPYVFSFDRVSGRPYQGHLMRQWLTFPTQSTWDLFTAAKLDVLLLAKAKGGKVKRGVIGNCFPGASSSSSLGRQGGLPMSHFTIRICSSVVTSNVRPLSNAQPPARSIPFKSVQRRLKMYQELVKGGKDHVILFLAIDGLYLVITEWAKAGKKAGRTYGL